MAFFHRAKSMYDRGEVVRAATILAEGLKREPSNVEALEWLLHLYVKEIPNPGLEIEVVKILAAQDNGLDLLELVQDELEAAQLLDKIKALDNVRRREGLLLALPHPAPGKPSRSLEFPRSAGAPSSEESDESEEDHEDHGDDKAAFAAFMTAAKGGAQAHDQTSESWKSFSDPTDEIAQVQARTPAVRTTPMPSPAAVADPVADRSASRSTRPLPPLDDASDDDNDDGDAGLPDAQRPVMTWVIVGVATALLVLALVMAFMRTPEATGVSPAPSNSDGSGGAGLLPGSASRSNA
jgi:hypothetical protein